MADNTTSLFIIIIYWHYLCRFYVRYWRLYCSLRRTKECRRGRQLVKIYGRHPPYWVVARNGHILIFINQYLCCSYTSPSEPLQTLFRERLAVYLSFVDTRSS